MIYILFLFLGILLAIPRILFTKDKINGEPHFTIEYSVGWSNDKTFEEPVSGTSVQDSIEFTEESLELENWMFEPELWTQKDNI